MPTILHSRAVGLPLFFLEMFAIEAISGHHSFSRKILKKLGFAVNTLLSNTIIASPLIGNTTAIANGLNAISPVTRGPDLVFRKGL